MGEGGCIATNNKKLAEYAKSFLAHGITKDKKFIIKKKKILHGIMKWLSWV